MSRGNKPGCLSHGRHGRDPESVKRFRKKQNEKYQSDPAYRAKVLEYQRNKYEQDTEFARHARAVVNSRRYGITPEEYESRRLLPCEICGTYKPPTRLGGKGQHIDHCHKTGRVRGTLCDDCNRGMGSFKDDSERLRSAADYLERYAALSLS